MKRLFKLIRNLVSLILFKAIYPSAQVIYIETNIFGHAILEAEIAFQQVSANPRDKYILTNHLQSANRELTKQIKKIFLYDKGIKHSRIANFAIQGEDFLRHRFKIRGYLKVLNYQSELTHQTASNLGSQHPKVLEIIQSQTRIISPDHRDKFLVMNRSDAYMKYKEDADLHRYRNFSFEPVEAAISKLPNHNQFARIGTLDSRSTTSKIRDFRPEVTKEPELDLAVQVSSKGYFGADSGPCWAALVLDKPVGFINMIPLNQPCPTDPTKLVVSFKPLYSISNRRLLTITEMVSPFVSNLRSTNDYVRANIEPIENSQEDICMCLEDFMDLATLGQKSSYDFEKMSWIREKINRGALPSISTRFLDIHPEIKLYP